MDQFESVIGRRDYQAHVVNGKDKEAHLAILIIGVFREGDSGGSDPATFDVIARQDDQDGTQWHGLDVHEGRTYTYNPSHEGL
jgi:hypothetical protein